MYLLAVALAATLLAGCAPIRETEPAIRIYMELQVHKTDSFKPAVRIENIQKVQDPGSRYQPSSTAESLWLRPGDYRAMLTCLRPVGDRYTPDILKEASPPNADGYVYFTVKSDPFEDPKTEVFYSFYYLDCAVTPDGKASFSIRPVVEVTAE